MEHSDFEDRVKGMIAFLAIGDALGCPHEFKYQKDIKYSGKIEHVPFIWNRFQGRKDLSLGQFSDDTEMTLTLARNLIRNKGKYDRNSVILDYLKWDNSGTPMRGKNTRALFDKITTISGYQGRFKKIFNDTGQDTWTQSNGCLMRCSPLALLKGFEAAVEDCAITNPHPVTKDACQVHIAALKAALLGKSKDGIQAEIRKVVQTKEVREVIEEALEGKKQRDITKNKGWVLHGLYCALTSLFHFDDPREAMDWVIRHPGSDTDTNGCICGSLLGAYYGFDYVMKDEITKENWRLVKNCDPSKGDVPREDKYLLKDFDSLCKDLVSISTL